MIPYKHGPKKKFPPKNGSRTVFSASDRMKNNMNYTEFGEEFFYSHEDPNGMYTGFPADRNEIPTQDADDL